MTTSAAENRSTYTFIEGKFPADVQPDGNSIVFEDDQQLVVLDTGRHIEHSDKILNYANERGKPITAIINTHWHLDHSSGNARIRAKFPATDLYTSDAVKGALKGFLIRNEARNRALLDDPATPETRKTDIRLYLAAITDPANLIANKPITQTTLLKMHNRELELRLATRAATEGDVWVIDSKSETVFVGDLVVVPVPFFDTACASGWQKALASIADTPFKTLVPGHGKPMLRSDFLLYQTAFNNLVQCAKSTQPSSECVTGWIRDAKPFVSGHNEVGEYITYYVEQVIRSQDKQTEFCGT